DRDERRSLLSCFGWCQSLCRGSVHHCRRDRRQPHRQMERQQLVGLEQRIGLFSQCSSLGRHQPLCRRVVHHCRCDQCQVCRQMERQQLVRPGRRDEQLCQCPPL